MVPRYPEGFGKSKEMSKLINHAQKVLGDLKKNEVRSMRDLQKAERFLGSVLTILKRTDPGKAARLEQDLNALVQIRELELRETQIREILQRHLSIDS